MASVTVSTDDLAQEVVELSQKLTELKPGVAAENICPKCWRPASEHRTKSVKGCKSKDKMEIEQYTRMLLAQRNNLVEMIKAAKGERVNEDEIEQLRMTIKYQHQELEAAKEKITGLLTRREVLSQLLRSLNNAYRVYTTGGSLDEMRSVFEHVDELMVDLNLGTKSKSSSSEEEEEDEGGGTPEDDSSGAWDYSASLRWPQSPNVGHAVNNVQYPSPGHHDATTRHGENRQQQNDAGNQSPTNSGAGARKKTVTFALYPSFQDPPSFQNDGQSNCQADESSGSGQSVFHVRGASPISNTPEVRPPTSNILANPPPVAPLRPRVPGFKDYPGVVLLHERGGTIAGGTPDGDKVMKAVKLVKTEFDGSDGPLQYLTKRRRFCDEISVFYSGEDQYTIMAIFNQKAGCYYKTTSQLFKMECTFTSFLNFLRIFEHRVFPTLDAIAMGALHTRVQGKNESASTYYNDFSDLIYTIGRVPEDYVHPFIAGLYNPTIAHQVADKVYEPGKRTLEAIANHASHIESEMGLFTIFRNRQLQRNDNGGTRQNDNHLHKNVSAITSATGQQRQQHGNQQRSNNVTQNGKSRDAARGTQRGVTQQRGASWSGGYTQRGNNYNYSSGGGGGNWARYSTSAPRGNNQQSGGAGMRTQSAGSSWGRGNSAGWSNPSSSSQNQRRNAAPRAASVAAASPGQSEPISDIYKAKMRKRGLSGCGACLAVGHEYRQSDQRNLCRKLCPCCGTDLKSQDHFAVDCDRMPDDKWAAIQMAREADSNGDVANDAE